MKRPAVIFFMAALFSVCHGSCFAFEWKPLHEKADKISLAEALAKAGSGSASREDLYMLGLVYLNRREDQKAGDIFNRMLSADKENPAARWGIAEVLRRGHRAAESEKMLEEVIKSAPAFAPAYNSLAYIAYQKMDFNKAIRLARKVLDMGRENVDTSNYARAYLMLGGSKGMLAHYGGPFSKIIDGTAVFPLLKKAEALQPDAPAVLFGMGNFYLLAPTLAGGNKEKAGEYLEKAVKADPLFADIYVRLAQSYKVKGDNAKYQAYLSKALEIDPKNELALDVKNGTCRFICTGS